MTVEIRFYGSNDIWKDLVGQRVAEVAYTH